MISWRTKSKWFGWDYAYVRSTATDRVCRVHVAPNGERVFEPYSNTVVVIPEPLPIDGKRLGSWHVVPLTPNVTEDKQKNTP